MERATRLTVTKWSWVAVFGLVFSLMPGAMGDPAHVVVFVAMIAPLYGALHLTLAPQAAPVRSRD